MNSLQNDNRVTDTYHTPLAYSCYMAKKINLTDIKDGGFYLMESFFLQKARTLPSHLVASQKVSSGFEHKK